MGQTTDIEHLLKVMSALRNPDGGCPWDLEQNFQSITPHTIEEAYEVADAIEHGTMDDVKDELGDLLFQVVFYAQMAAENGDFDFYDIAGHVAEKYIRRHPHVFGDKDIKTADGVVDAWEDLKAAERAEKGEKPRESAMDGVARGLPALLRSQKLLSRAAKAGFEWPDTAAVLDKITEEVAEFEEALAEKDADEAELEFGDILINLVNIARMNGIDAETALRRANTKFESRFKTMESDLKSKNKDFKAANLNEKLEAWKRAKR